MHRLPMSLRRNGRRAGAALILWVGAVAPPALAADEPTLGTIHATVGGEARTWYVLAGGKVSGAGITKLAPGLLSVVIVGFESKEVKLSRDATSGELAVAGTGSQITISFRYRQGAGRVSHRLPADDKQSAAIMLIPSVKDVTVLHDMAEGRLTASSIEQGDSARLGFRGTFSGTLENDAGETMATVTDGAFRVDGFEVVKPALPSR